MKKTKQVLECEKKLKQLKDDIKSGKHKGALTMEELGWYSVVFLDDVFKRAYLRSIKQ